MWRGQRAITLFVHYACFRVADNPLTAALENASAFASLLFNDIAEFQCCRRTSPEPRRTYCFHLTGPSTTPDTPEPSAPLICSSNQPRARRQSRVTVSTETLSTAAVSSTLNPPKYRSSTTLAFRGSNCASATSASFTAISCFSFCWLRFK